MKLVSRRVGDRRILRLLRAWLEAGVLDDGEVRHPDKGTPQGGVISPLLSNIMLHEIDQQWCETDGRRIGPARLIRYADDMLLLAPAAEAAEAAWQAFQRQVDALHLAVNPEKSRLTTASEGFAFLGFEFRQPERRLYMWPQAKARQNIGRKIRATVRSIPGTLAREVVDRVQHTKPPAVLELVGHEVHRPALVLARGSDELLPRCRRDVLAPPPTDQEPLLAVQPQHLLAVDPEALLGELPVQQPIAPARTPGRPQAKPHAQLLVLAALPLVATRRTVEPDDLACPPLRERETRPQVRRRLAPLRHRHHFFPRPPRASACRA
jgi:hypothetical protein